MKKEIKIGIYAVVIILAAWAGIRFLSGLDVFGRTNTYIAHYEKVDGLQDAAAVTINGVKVGQVTDVELNFEKGGVDVTLSVNNDIDIPADSRAMMYSAGLMGGKSIEIKLGESEDILQNGATIETGVTLDMFDTLTNELGDVKEKVTTLIDNIEGFCATLSANGEKLDGIITNINDVTHSLSEQNLGEKLNNAIAEVNTLLTKVNSGSGTIGNLLSDAKLYKELAQASQNLSALLADLKENPKRYINVTVFGGKSYDEKQAEKAAKKAAKEAKKNEK